MELMLWIFSGIGFVVLLILILIIINYIRYRKFEISLFGFNPLKEFRERYHGDETHFFKKTDSKKDDDEKQKKLGKKNIKIEKTNEKNQIEKISYSHNQEQKGVGEKKEKPKKEILKKYTEEKTVENRIDKLIEKFKGEKKTAITFTSLNEILEKVNDKEISSILEYLKSENISTLYKLILNRTFESMEDFLKFLLQELVIFLKDEYNNLKTKISELRKGGEDVDDPSLRLMSVPLKIRIFESSFLKKDFDNVIRLIEGVKIELKTYDK
jgi:hypothetical protein